MKRILVVSHSFLANDPRVRRAVYALVDDGWSVEGLFLDDPSREECLRTWRVPIARRQGGPVRYAFEYGAFFFWMLAWVFVRSIRHRPAVVYVNSPPDALALAALPAKVLGAKVILDIHDPMPELFTAKGRRSSAVWRALAIQERMGVEAADALITVHEPLADVIRRRLPDAEFSIVMNVPDPKGWPELRRDPSSRAIVFTGTVANRYGLDDVIRAVAQIGDEIPNLSFRIVGDGEDLGMLKRLAGDLGVSDQIDFVGRVPYIEIRSQIDGAWLGINVPKPDDLGELSFSNKVVEWVSIGLPVLAARTTTMERYLPEGTLIYTAGGDVDAIADTIREIDSMPDEEMDRHVAASHTALDAISWDVQKRSLLSVVEQASS